MIESVIAFLVLFCCWALLKLLAVPAFIAAYATLAFAMFSFVVIAIVAVALACRGVDKIRDGI